MTLALFAAIIVGVLIAIQATIIGAFGATAHPFVAAMWVHLGGFVFGVVAILVTGLGFEWAAVRQAPWGMLGGVAGMLLVTGMAMAIGGLGLGTTLAIVTGVQLIGAFAIEAAGWSGPTVPIDLGRVLGAVLIVAGVVLIFGRGQAAA